MGSGETSPTMVTPHQGIFSSLSQVSGEAIVLDTPFGFQENADDLTARIADYFVNSVGQSTTPVSLRSRDVSASAIALAVSAIRSAKWLFAGPGSPSYALRVWKESGVSQHFDAVLETGTVVLASAAALTAGSHTIPVYEIYKVGQDLHWLDGLNLLERHTGLKAAVIPHFDNAEGHTHDTRYCYMGERRLRILEQQLPNETFILGIDEHTGAAFDLDTRQVHVFGRGVLTVRRGDHTWTLPAGQSTTFEQIAHHGNMPRLEFQEHVHLHQDADAVEQLLETGDVLSAVDALLELDELDRDLETRATVHALITRLGQIAASPRINLDDVVGPYIEVLLQARQAARLGGRWGEADEIRNQLLELKVTIQDTPQGSTWEIATQ